VRVIQVLPGSGDNFYCENCVRDNNLVRALHKSGVQVVAVPMYLPQMGDKVDLIAEAPVFYGGVNSWLQQNFGFFRRTPRWLDRLFDAKWILRKAARKAGSVRARGLGELTLSVMQGEEGKQAKELKRLLEWLEGMEKPDVVHLSTPLLIGIGLAIRKRFGVPIVVTLQDEDVWIDAMEEPWRTRCWETMAAGGRDVAAWLAPSRWFGDVMRERLRLPEGRLHVVPVGIDPAFFTPAAAAPPAPAIGFLARRSKSMGLDLLFEAYSRLRKAGRHPGLRLHVSGGMTGDDRPFQDELRARVAAEGLVADVAFYDDFTPPKRLEFLRSLSVLSVPTPAGVAFGTYLLEAMACGVPVVQPRTGSFPEILEATGGGVLCPPGDADALAGALSELLADPARRAELARRGRDSVVKSLDLDTMARTVTGIYQGVLQGTGSPAGKPA
jgi:glycosyltransferase involved in cell wall biosynthesis